MNRLTSLVSILVLLLASAGCDSSVSPKDDGQRPEVIYFNSFESFRDAEGWTGVYEQMFVPDPAPNGGRKSLHIGGGCVMPTAQTSLGERRAGGDYTISCWGRLDDAGQRGAVALAAYLDGQRCAESSLVMTTGEWDYYTSAEPLSCEPGAELRIEISIGGIVAASMSLDCLEVQRVD